jgi:hypothetical protein
MGRLMTEQVLEFETAVFSETGGISGNNRRHGFRPAFLDTDTDAVYLSCFVGGHPAPFHLLDGLPDDLVLARSPSGRVEAVKPSVISGFVRDDRFYTREEAAETVATLN